MVEELCLGKNLKLMKMNEKRWEYKIKDLKGFYLYVG